MVTYLEESLNRPIIDLLKIIQDRITSQETYFGVPAQKNPLDFWTYQEIIFEIKPIVVVEIGTYHGGSTLALAHFLDSLHQGRIISIDLDHAKLPEIVRNHPRITLVTGDACEKYDSVSNIVGKDSPVIVIEDSSHTFDNTLNVLRKYGSLVTADSYMIVEDGICHHGLEVGPCPGPYEAITKFLEEDTLFEVDRSRESYIVTWNPRGYLKKRAVRSERRKASLSPST
jgi:cephalosporin hydroxylase